MTVKPLADRVLVKTEKTEATGDLFAPVPLDTTPIN